MNRTALFVAAAITFLLAASSLNAAERTSKGTPVVSKRHGPWMIQVIAMKSETAKQRTLNEMKGRELVRQLRKLGIPAYLVVRTINVQQGVKKVDKPKKYTEMLVLAGNYESGRDPVARKTLDYVRGMVDSPVIKKSKLLKDIRKHLRRAFLRPNPLL